MLVVPVAAALSVIVKLPALGTQFFRMAVVSAVAIVAITREVEVTALLAMVTTVPAAAMLHVPDSALTVALPGVPLELALPKDGEVERIMFQIRP